MATYVAETFEMLWDCPACGSTKLLGVTHRYCPGCGHPQDHDRRYFPKEGERVPTAYRGCAADKVCHACSTACGASDANCFGCGSPLAGAKQVHVRRSIADGAGETGAQAKAEHEARKAARRLTSGTGVRTDGHKVSGVVPMSPTWVRDQVIDNATTQSEPISRVTLADLYPEPEPAVPRRWRPNATVLVIAGIVVLAASILVMLLWKRDAVLEVTGHQWERSIEVERYSAVEDRAWCSSMPHDAYSVSRRSEVHHTDRVADGEDCRTISGSESCSTRDNGNGSASRVCTKTPDRRECTTRYKEVKRYSDRCYFTVDRWRTTRTARASAWNLAPVWPETKHKACDATRLGCERPGDRLETYTLTLVETGEEEEHACEFGEEKWASFTVGQHVGGEVGVMTGSLDCDTLATAEAE
jgi:hypothetical protein